MRLLSWGEGPWSHPHFWVLPLLIAGVLGVLTLVVATSRLRQVYRGTFQGSEPRERMFLASIGFFTAVAVVRGLTLAIHHHWGPFLDISVRGRHIHHLVWGILLLLLTGYSFVAGAGSGDGRLSRWTARLMAMLYGVAAALTLDEFALWLNLRDVYWEREGRESFEALGLFGALLSIGVFGRRFFKRAVKGETAGTAKPSA